MTRTVHSSTPPELDPGQRVITVCAACECASCWRGKFMCQRSPDANTKRMTVAELRELGLESPHYWEPEESDHG